MGTKLHYHPLSTYSRHVRIAFAEKQIPRRLTPLLWGGSGVASTTNEQRSTKA